MTRVVVVSDSPVLRAGLLALLGAEPGVIVIGAVGERGDEHGDGGDGEGGDETYTGSPPLTGVAAALMPDVVVWAPDPAAGADALRALQELQVRRGEEPAGERSAERPAAPSARPPLVVLLDRADRHRVARALRAGARAVLPLDADAASVLAATRAAAAGLVTVPWELAAELLVPGMAEVGATSADALPPADGTLAPLTPREREVLALLARGLANKQMAARLGITEHTVKAHVASIYEKLHAGNRAEAVVAAARRGLLLL